MGNLTPGPYTIDCLTWDKTATLEIGQGYDLRPPDTVIDALVLHSTNGNGANFNAECAYLRDARDKSTHYMVGEKGQIGRLLDPRYRAWHAGLSLYTEARIWPGLPKPSPYDGRRAWNDFSIGIELVHKVGTEYPLAQLTALRWLVNELRANYRAIQRMGHVAHRWIAVDQYDHYGRKVDPSDMTDLWLRNWIQSL
ncbi:MAG TPA: N-acetylmuramoyl-L-alanine amidase [Chloroflexia bacterium]